MNATFYGAQKPESFARWRAATPDGFVFAVKAARATTHRKEPADIEAAVGRFLGSGITELAEKLGPILWQFPPTRKFDAGALEAFLALLPKAQDGVPLRHVVEARHPSFSDPAYVALLRRFGVAHALIDSDKQALLADQTADFVYARLQRSQETEAEGYPPAALDRWADRFRAWSSGPRGRGPAAGRRYGIGRSGGAGLLRLLYQRRQSARAGGRDGDARTPPGLSRSRLSEIGTGKARALPWTHQRP
ncbi:MAG: DUF72 domain-containing protein [Acetobacteraceae bacterium]